MRKIKSHISNELPKFMVKTPDNKSTALFLKYSSLIHAPFGDNVSPNSGYILYLYSIDMYISTYIHPMLYCIPVVIWRNDYFCHFAYLHPCHY